MDPLLKGNYQIKKRPDEPASADAETPPATSALTEQFEHAALRRLAGSIAFVRKDLFVWRGDGKASQDASEQG